MSLLNGEYELGRRLGGGAEGDVFEAVSTKTGGKVAVKIARRRQEGLLESVRRLKGSFLGPCAAVLDAFEHAGAVVTVLELVDGVPLREAFGGDRPMGERLAIARALLRAVQELHQEGLAHGDLSPDNVFVAAGNKVKLIDPRLAAKAATGSVLGTTNYTAPEMLLYGSVPNARGDVFALCALLYELFEGKDAFGCLSPEEYVLKSGSKSLAVQPFQKTPPPLRDMVAAGLALDPRERPRTVAQLLEIYEAPGRRRRRAALLAAGLSAAALAAGAWSLRPAAAMDSIAVLPFVNEGGDPESEYLCDGLTESLINGLAQLPGLRVSPRSAAFRYKGSASDPSSAARELGVRGVVTGRLRRRGESMLVSVELLDAGENKQVWGELYDRKASAALKVQQDISGKIFESLRAKMSRTTRQRLTKRGTEVPQAYEAYLKGRYYWNRRTGTNIVKALEQFQRAVDADPAYALAYIGLADSYALQEQYAGVSSADSLPKARAAARRALELDDSIAEAHASLGYIALMSWDLKEAEKELLRSLDLDPAYPTARMWYGSALHVSGRYDEALAQARTARALDPLTPINGTLACNIQLIKGDTASGVEDCRKVLEIDEKFPRAHDLLGWAYLEQGRTKEGLAELEKASAASGACQELGYLGWGYGKAGRAADARRVLSELEKRRAKRQCPGMFLAAVHAGLGDKDAAFSWLEKDFQERSGVLVYVTYFPVYGSLRSDPRYAGLLRRMGIR